MAQQYYEEYWRRDSWPADVPRGRFPPELRRLFEAFISRSAEVLDAGCGDGANYGQWVAEHAGNYVGVDVSERAVTEARARGLDARVVADLATLEFPDAHFDVCLAIEVLEHLTYPAVTAKELLRVLKPAGLLIATVPNIVYWRRRLDYSVLGRWHPGGHPHGALYPWRDPHLRFFTVDTLRRMLIEVGFDVSEVRGINGSLFGDLPFLRRRFASDTISRPFSFLQVMWPGIFGANLAARAERPSR